MRKLLAFCVLLVLASAAPAHFIWLVPGPEKDGTALMIFSDDLSADPRVPVSKIAKTTLFAHASEKADPIVVKIAAAKDAYQVSAEGEGLMMIAGNCTMGVRSKGQAVPYLLVYHPKAIVRKGAQKVAAPWLFSGSAELPLEVVAVAGKGVRHKVLWQGKPAADVEMTLIVPGVKDPVETKTDANGLFEVAQPKDGGLYGMRAKFVEKKAGELDGKKYEEIHHFATFTFAIPEWLVPKERKKTDG